jgi:hypothetical protein
VDSDGIVGLVAVILLFGGGTLFLLSVSPVGKAFAARILGKKQGAEAPDDQTAEEIKDLRQEVEELRHFGEQVNELGERVDFLERFIAKQREAERLPPVR